MPENDQRQGKVDRAARTGIVARGVSILASLMTVPLALDALGTHDFGVWSTITSALALLMFLDFGIGNGAMSRLTTALARDEEATIGHVVWNVLMLMASIGLAFALLLSAAHATGALGWLAQRSGSFLKEHLDLAVLFMALYALAVPATFVQRLCMAYHEGGFASLLQMVFSLTYLAFALLARQLHWGLDAFVLTHVACLAIVHGAGLWWFLRRHDIRLPRNKAADRPLMARLLREGSLFFLLQVTVAIVYNADPWILSAYVGPEEVAQFTTASRIFGLIIMVNGLLLGPLWPAYADAMARKDHAWVRHAYRRNLARSLVFSLLAASVLCLVGQHLIKFWTQGRVQVEMFLLLAMGAWVILEGYGQAMAMVLNARLVIRMQAVTALALLLVGTAAKIFLAQRMGLYGPLLGTIFAFILIVAIPQTRYVAKLLGEHP